MESHELLGLRVWQRVEQHAVDDREDDRVGGDAQGDRHHHGGEAGCLVHQPQPVAQVLPQILEEVDAARVTAVLFRLLQPAEVLHGGEPRFVRAHAGRDVLLYLSLNVVAQLRVQLALGL